MKLRDLNPSFYSMGGEGIFDAAGNPVPERKGMGLILACPCGCGLRGALAFENPLDGGPPRETGHRWQRTGETLDTLTLVPSVLLHPNPEAVPPCKGWHGYITKGEIVSA